MFCVCQSGALKQVLFILREGEREGERERGGGGGSVGAEKQTTSMKAKCKLHAYTQLKHRSRTAPEKTLIMQTHVHGHCGDANQH